MKHKILIVFVFWMKFRLSLLLATNSSSLITVKEFKELVDLIYEESRLRIALDHDVGNLQQRLMNSQSNYNTLQKTYANLSKAYDDLKRNNDDLLRKYTAFTHTNQTVHATITRNHADIAGLQQKTGYLSAFTAWSPSSTSVTEPIVFTSALTNVGSHYDTSNGKFTCQYPGLYIFTLNLYKYPSTSYSGVYCYIRLNGVSKIQAYNYPYSSAFGGYFETTNSVIMHLNRGDVVTIGGCSGYVHSYSAFSGYLVKAD